MKERNVMKKTNRIRDAPEKIFEKRMRFYDVICTVFMKASKMPDAH